METGGPGGTEINSAAIAKAHLLAERRFLDETGLPPLIGRSFSRHDIPRLLLDVIGQNASDENFSFEALLDDYKSHGARMMDTAHRENHKQSEDLTGHGTGLINTMAENEMLNFSKVTPNDVGNPGERYLRYLLTELLRGTPCGPLHAVALVLNWMKFNHYKPGQLLCGGFLVHDLLSLVKLGLNINQVNVQLSQVECHGNGGRRPTEKEVKELCIKLLSKVTTFS